MLTIGRRLALLGLLAVAVTACGGDDGDGGTGPGDITGTYTIQTINGAPPPYTLWTEAEAGFQREITGGSVTLNADGTYSDVFHFRDTEAGVVTTGSAETEGTYTRSGSTIAFEALTGEPQAPATIQNGALVYDLGDEQDPIIVRLTK